MIDGRRGSGGRAPGTPPAHPRAAARHFDQVLFDLDGTLIDSVRLILDSYHHALRVHRGESRPDDHWRRGLGRPLEEVFATVSDEPREIRALVDTYRRHNRAHHDEGVQAFPGVAACLDALAGAGVRLAVVTSKTAAIARRGLEVCGVAGRFEFVLGGDQVVRHKPHPEPVLRALDRLGGRPERTLFVGDSPQDLEAGRRAGVRTGAALWGPFPRAELAAHAPDHWLGGATDVLRAAGISSTDTTPTGRA